MKSMFNKIFLWIFSKIVNDTDKQLKYSKIYDILNMCIEFDKQEWKRSINMAFFPLIPLIRKNVIPKTVDGKYYLWFAQLRSMKKYIANILTGSRAVFSLPLLFIPLSSAWFYILYLFCGLTDMIDGTIARKTGTVSKLGAKLDTVSDFVFMFVCWVKILPQMHIPVWLWIWIIIIALTKIFNIALVFVHKKKLITIHSILNKTTGFALFLLPFSLTFVKTTYSITTICVLATIAVIQEIYFIAKGQEVL